MPLTLNFWQVRKSSRLQHQVSVARQKNQVAMYDPEVEYNPQLLCRCILICRCILTLSLFSNKKKKNMLTFPQDKAWISWVVKCM